MIETKLYQAAQVLPEPTGSFSQVEERANWNMKKSSVKFSYYRRAAVVLACVCLLMGGVAVAATTDVDYSAWATSSGTFPDAERIADRMGVVLPEALDDSPFYNITTMYVVPQGTSYLEAISTPVYRWYAVDYGVQDVVRQYASDDPDSWFSESSVVYDEYSLSIGSTDGKLWNYVFSLDEDGDRVYEDALPGSERSEEYNGVTLQIGTEIQYDREDGSDVFSYHHRVLWVDKSNNTVFVLHKAIHAEEETAEQLPDEMIGFAKEIIDLNRP